MADVIDPRGVLRDFGVALPEDVEVRVWDSTAELRYLVLPRRPEGTETRPHQAKPDPRSTKAGNSR